MNTNNAVLDSLSVPLLQQIVSKIHRVVLEPGTAIGGGAAGVRHLYFLTGGFASCFVLTAEGASAETGMTGAEGVVGLHNLLGDHPSVAHWVSRSATVAWQMPVHAARELFNHSAEFRSRMMDSMQMESTVTARLAACNILHEAEGRVARWLLTAADRSHGGPLQVTQQELASLLAIRRTTVSIAMSELQEKGAIQCVRGFIRFFDVPALRRASCSCYVALRELHRRQQVHATTRSVDVSIRQGVSPSRHSE